MSVCIIWLEVAYKTSSAALSVRYSTSSVPLFPLSNVLIMHLVAYCKNELFIQREVEFPSKAQSLDNKSVVYLDILLATPIPFRW